MYLTAARMKRFAGQNINTDYKVQSGQLQQKKFIQAMLSFVYAVGEGLDGVSS